MLTGNGDKGVSIMCDGQNYKHLCISNLVLWNDGRMTVRREDIAPISPIRIETCEECIIYGCEVLDEINSANNFSCKIIDNQIKVDFDYLNKNDGVAFQILHTGSGTALRIDGDIIGGAKINKPWSANRMYKKVFRSRFMDNLYSSKIFNFIILFFTLVMFPIAFLQSGNYGYIPVNLLNSPKSIWSLSLDLFFIIIESLISIAVSWKITENIFRTVPPKKLLSYLQYER